MGIVTKLGLWLDRRFPAKMSVDEVQSKLNAYDAQINEANAVVQEMAKLMEGYEKTSIAHGLMLAELAKKVEVLTSESTALKAQAALRTRIASSIPMPGR